MHFDSNNETAVHNHEGAFFIAFRANIDSSKWAKKTCIWSNLEFLMQRFYVIFHPLHKLGLVFSDGSTNMRSDEQGIESRKYAEHLVGILGCPKLITQSRCDSSLNSVNSLIISVQMKSNWNLYNEALK